MVIRPTEGFIFCPTCLQRIQKPSSDLPLHRGSISSLFPSLLGWTRPHGPLCSEPSRRFEQREPTSPSAGYQLDIPFSCARPCLLCSVPSCSCSLPPQWLFASTFCSVSWQFCSRSPSLSAGTSSCRYWALHDIQVPQSNTPASDFVQHSHNTSVPPPHWAYYGYLPLSPSPKCYLQRPLGSEKGSRRETHRRVSEPGKTPRQLQLPQQLFQQHRRVRQRRHLPWHHHQRVVAVGRFRKRTLLLVCVGSVPPQRLTGAQRLRIQVSVYRTRVAPASLTVNFLDIESVLPRRTTKADATDVWCFLRVLSTHKEPNFKPTNEPILTKNPGKVIVRCKLCT